MSYYFSKTIEGTFEDVLERTVESLKEGGFGVLTDIDVKQTLYKKMEVDFRNYRILGACNPPFAYKALLAEDKIGAMLPCNVIVQELESCRIEVAAIDPIASMQAVANPELLPVAQTIQQLMKDVVDRV